ncbi:MAG: hypothetical protein CMN34_07050 [Saprospirales bacterium]|nr:hypothetical protein [Saprospirales bacterium]|tara:strand:- start:691 stop:1278 length:588 start_codon:yes stop_codon:yes gene_type:complete
MKHSSILFALVLTLHNVQVIAQNDVLLLGKVVSYEAASEMLYGVSIRGLNNNVAAITNGQGDFSVSCQVGDSIEFSMLGFKNQKFIVPPEATDGDDYRIVVRMIPDFVELDMVEIVPWPRNYNEFKRAFLDVEVDNPMISSMAGFMVLDRAPEEAKPNLFNPASLLLSNIGKKARQNRRMRRIRKRLNKMNIEFE